MSSNAKHIAQLDDLLKSCGYQKKAADIAAEVKAKTDSVISPTQGAAGTEMTKDVKDAVPMTDTKNQEGAGTAQLESLGVKPLAAENKADATVKKEKNSETEEKMSEKQAFIRNSRLGNRITELLSAGQTKEASAKEPSIEEMERILFLRGLEKKAEDVNELVYGGNLAPAAATALLDKIAEENPELVLPEEMVAPEEVAAAEAANVVPPEAAGAEGVSDAEIEAIADQLDASGVEPEDLEQALGVIEELRANGVSDDEIAAAAQEVIQEAGEPKEAAERRSIIKQFVRQMA